MRRAIVGGSTNPGPTSPHAGKATLERDMTGAAVGDGLAPKHDT
jgi:hypothetical protein